jgi:hypothetical protein
MMAKSTKTPPPIHIHVVDVFFFGANRQLHADVDGMQRLELAQQQAMRWLAGLSHALQYTPGALRNALEQSPPSRQTSHCDGLTVGVDAELFVCACVCCSSTAASSVASSSSSVVLGRVMEIMEDRSDLPGGCDEALFLLLRMGELACC